MVNLELMLVVPPGGQNWNKWSLIFLPTEFACFVAGEIIQVIEAMPGSVVPLAMFLPPLNFSPFSKRLL